MPDLSGHVLLYALLLILPVSALIARRVPVIRVLFTALSWFVIFGLLIFVVGQRSRFDPYLSKIASALNLDDQSVVGKEVRIRMSPDGHFWAKVMLDGVSRRMLIDSGATITAVSEGTAAAAGLKVEDNIFPTILQTANGAINAQGATVEDLRLGNITARDLPVVVSPAFGDTNVLGMNFLSRLKSWRVEDRTLILVPHHPQA